MRIFQSCHIDCDPLLRWGRRPAPSLPLWYGKTGHRRGSGTVEVRQLVESGRISPFDKIGSASTCSWALRWRVFGGLKVAIGTIGLGSRFRALLGCADTFASIGLLLAQGETFALLLHAVAMFRSCTRVLKLTVRKGLDVGIAARSGVDKASSPIVLHSGDGHKEAFLPLGLSSEGDGDRGCGAAYATLRRIASQRLTFRKCNIDAKPWTDLQA